MNRKEKVEKYVPSLVAILVTVAVAAGMYFRIDRSMIIPVVAAIIVALILRGMVFPKQMEQTGKQILRFRWLIALAVFVFCLIFRLHGSSMGIYNMYLPTVTDQKQEEGYNIIGQDRIIRTDEWAVQTPAFFSQYYNSYDMTSQQMSVGKENMVLFYYAPVKDITAIGKPFSWGYLLFGNEVGLSWYWCGQLILLFMTAFEMFMILTQKNVRLSVAGMFMIALSPCIQWWFLPHMPIVFLYAMGLFDIGYYFFTAKKQWMKWLMTLIAGPAIVGFALSLFPSCQLVTGLVAFTLLVLCLIRDREQIDFTIRQWYRIAIPVVVIGVVMGYFGLFYLDDLKAEMGTVYPGKRVSVGGDNTLYDLFTNLSSLYLPYKDSNVWNNSEVSTYIQFAPFFLLLLPSIARYLKQKNDRDLLVGKGLFVIMLVQIEFMCAGFSETLSRLTMFKYVNRMQIPYGWAAVIFTIWCICAVWKYKGAMFKRWQKFLYPCIFGFIYCTFIDDSVRAYLPLRWTLLEILLFVVILLCAMYGRKRIFSCLMIGVMCAAGLLVNPISHGISPITNHPLSAFIEETAKEDPDAEWITVDTVSQMANFVMANGGRVLNGTNFLPDFDKWEILDPDGTYEEVWNRYLNQTVTLTDDQTSIEKVATDAALWHLNPEDMVRLGVKYVLSTTDITEFTDAYDLNVSAVFEEDGYTVYMIE